MKPLLACGKGRVVNRIARATSNGGARVAVANGLELGLSWSAPVANLGSTGFLYLDRSLSFFFQGVQNEMFTSMDKVWCEFVPSPMLGQVRSQPTNV